MGLQQKFQNWTASHNPKWLALIRVAVGAALLLKGVHFLNNLPELRNLIRNNNIKYGEIIETIIPWVHVAGGFLLIIGLFTRFAAFIQIPFLLGAILFINNSKGSIFESNPFFIVILILLLIVFVIEGSGPLSLASYFKEAEEESEAAATE